VLTGFHRTPTRDNPGTTSRRTAFDAYRRLARSLRAVGARVTLATHDAALRDGLLTGLGPMDVEMLLGVRPEDHAPLLARGVTPRLYVPHGRDWFRYWMRRVAESHGAG
jgi:proline dehydrogenase